MLRHHRYPAGVEHTEGSCVWTPVWLLVSYTSSWQVMRRGATLTLPMAESSRLSMSLPNPRPAFRCWSVPSRVSHMIPSQYRWLRPSYTAFGLRISSPRPFFWTQPVQQRAACACRRLRKRENPIIAGKAVVIFKVGTFSTRGPMLHIQANLSA